MTRHYTFRTTRDTEWLDGILGAVAEKDRAKYIRELIIKGLGNVTQTEHVPNTLVTQVEHKPNTIVTQEKHVEIDREVELPKKNKNISAFT